MERGPTTGDAFGLALLDYLEQEQQASAHLIEREDGLLEPIDTGVFFDGGAPWSGLEESVPRRAGNRVLDVGAGAGRHSLVLQEADRDVLALDISPGAVEVSKRRGVQHTFEGSIFELAQTQFEPFDTFLLCGHNYGLLESAGHAQTFLGTLAQLAKPGARVIGTGLDPFQTTNPLHLAYHQLNRKRGRLPGQVRLRSRWRNVASPWFDYLFVPVVELASIAGSSGWRLTDHEAGPASYLAILDLES